MVDRAAVILVRLWHSAASATIGGAIGGVAGGITGVVNAVPKGEAQKIEATVKNAFDGISIQKTMAVSVLKNFLELPNYVFVLLEEDDSMISTISNFDGFVKTPK
jgi:hypothetical protein